MERYPLEELRRRWLAESLTLEQMIGQLLLWVIYLASIMEKNGNQAGK